MNQLKKTQRKASPYHRLWRATGQVGFLRDRQSGFAVPIAILIVVVLIVAGGAGYYFYKTSKVPKIEEVKEEIKKECLREGETYMPGEDKQCCTGLEGMTITYGDGIICTVPMGYVCTAFCGDGKCEGEYENACSCPEDCPKFEEKKISCTKSGDCGTDTCQQGRDKCIEIKYVCENGKCFSATQEFPGFMCQKSDCKDTCGNGICEGEYEKLHCPEDCLVIGGPCFYDKFKGECKITSILNENVVRFRFIPTEPLNLEGIEWAKEVIDRELEKYAGYLGLKCLDKYPITKADLEKCNIKENAVLDCELEVITSGTCNPIVFKFYTNELIEEKISYDGIVLVRAGSELEDVAGEIANKRGWLLLTVDSSDPVEIRNAIIANNKNAEYLLIVGDDAEIPVIERSKELIADKYRANHGFAPLDMLYYGNVDEDYFIELSVGRLPFSSPDEVRQYLNTLQKIKENDLSILEYPAIGPPTADQIISMLYYDAQHIKTYTKPVKDDAFSVVESGGTVIISAHASASCFGAFCKGDIPIMNKNVIVIANSCNMAKQVGRDFLNGGAAAFLGFYFEAGPELDFSFLLKEPTIGKALKRRVNEIISMAEVGTSGRERRTGRADIIEHVPNFGIPSVLVLYGDPTMNISYTESLIIVKTTPDSIKIQLPFKLSNLDHYSHFNPIIVGHIQRGEYFEDERDPFIRNDVFIKVDESEIGSLPVDLTVFSKVNPDMYDPVMEDSPFDYAVVYDKEWVNWYYILPLEKSVLQHSTTASIVVNNTQIDLYGGAELLMGDKEAFLVIAITINDLVEMLYNQIPNGPIDIIIPLD